MKKFYLWVLLLIFPAALFAQSPSQHFENFLEQQGFDLEDPVFSVLKSNFTSNSGEAIIMKKVVFADGPYLVFFSYQYPLIKTSVLGTVEVNKTEVIMDPRTFPLFWEYCSRQNDIRSFTKATKDNGAVEIWDAGGQTNAVGQEGEVFNTQYEMGSRDQSLSDWKEWGGTNSMPPSEAQVEVQQVSGGNPESLRITFSYGDAQIAADMKHWPSSNKVLLYHVRVGLP